MDFDNEVRKSNRGKTVLLDSDYRGGAILYSFTTALLFSYAVVNCIMWQEVRVKPTQNITYGSATTVFAISIVISVVAGTFLIYSFYKLLLSSQMRDKIKKDFISWASAPSGGRPSDKVTSEDIKNIPIDLGEERGRDFFSTEQLSKRPERQFEPTRPQTRLELSDF